MYHFLGQVNPDTADYEAAVQDGEATNLFAEAMAATGPAQTVDVTDTSLAQLQAPTVMATPKATVVSIPAQAAAVTSLPTTVNPLQIAPGVYVNPQAAGQVVTAAAAAAGAPAAVPFNFNTWLTQTTGGVKNQTLLIAAGLFGGLAVVLGIKKKKRR